MFDYSHLALSQLLGQLVGFGNASLRRKAMSGGWLPKTQPALIYPLWRLVQWR